MCVPPLSKIIKHFRRRKKEEANFLPILVFILIVNINIGVFGHFFPKLSDSARTKILI